MDTNQVIHVREEGDIAAARMQVRTVARQVGLNLFDQARISLATSTLAIILGMETQAEGEIAIDAIRDRGRVGVRVVCTKANANVKEVAATVIGDAKQLIDELHIEPVAPAGVRVILHKWSTADEPRSASAAGSTALALEPGSL